MSDLTKKNRVLRGKCLLNKLKRPEEPGMLWFCSDEKNVDQDRKVNRKNDRWLCSNPTEVSTVMQTKFFSSVMVLEVISSEGHVMPPHFFQEGLWVNADGCIRVLETEVRPWIDRVARWRSYVFQHDLVPAHKAEVTQEWLAQDCDHHVTPNIWPPSSPDVNPMD